MPSAAWNARPNRLRDYIFPFSKGKVSALCPSSWRLPSLFYALGEENNMQSDLMEVIGILMCVMYDQNQSHPQMRRTHRRRGSPNFKTSCQTPPICFCMYSVPTCRWCCGRQQTSSPCLIRISPNLDGR